MSSGRLACALLVFASACAFDTGGVDFTRDSAVGPTPDGGNDGPDASVERTDLARGDMRLALGEVASDKVHTRRWSLSGLDWEDGASTPATTGSPLWPVAEVGPGDDPDELVAAQVKRVGGHRFVVYGWDGEAWQSELGANTALTLDSKRSFDIAFERQSGDALVVYANDTATPTFQVRTGGQWSDATQLPLNDGPGDNPDTNLGIVHWVELESDPSSDYIALAYTDSNRDLVTIVWDGDAWVKASAKTLDTNVKQNPITMDVANRAFDLAFEAISGDLVVSWGSNSASWPHWQLWSRATGNWMDQAEREDNVIAGSPHFIDLESDPMTDRIVGGFYDLGDGVERLGVAIWNGSQWIDKRELDSQIRDVNDGAIGDQPGAVGWLYASGVAVVVYADDQPATLDWARWDQARGWNLESDVAFAGKGYTESMAMRATAAGDRMVVLLSDDSLKLFTTTFNGGTWQVSNGGQPLSTVLASGESVAFSLAVRR